jgi:hypothetical protein
MECFGKNAREAKHPRNFAPKSVAPIRLACLVAITQLVVLRLNPIANTSAEQFVSGNPQLY